MWLLTLGRCTSVWNIFSRYDDASLMFLSSKTDVTYSLSYATMYMVLQRSAVFLMSRKTSKTSSLSSLSMSSIITATGRGRLEKMSDSSFLFSNRLFLFKENEISAPGILCGVSDKLFMYFAYFLMGLESELYLGDNWCLKDAKKGCGTSKD